MSSAVKPLTATSSPAGGNQVNKNMHPQGTTSYNQPAHVPQSLGNMHTNTNVAHNHQNQQHHYSLNVPNTSGHFTNQNMGQIPASNHPVANPSSTAAGQGYSPQKNVTNFSTNYQANLAHPQNSAISSQNSTLQVDKAHSNGTSETKSPAKTDDQDNFSLPTKDKVALEAPIVPQQEQDKSSASLSVDIAEPKAATPPPVTKESPSVDPSNEPSDTVSAITDSPIEDDKIASEAIEETDKQSDKDTDRSDNQETKSTSSSEPENLIKAPENKDHGNDDVADESVKSDETTIASSTENKPSSEQSPTKEPLQQKSSPTMSTSSVVTPKSARSKAQSKSDEPAKMPKEPKTPLQKSPSTSKAKRQRIRTQPYQSPLPEMELISKISTSTPRNNDDKLIVFYRNEFLAVRNAEGSFYLCQAVQNIYKSSSKIKIRWLSLDKNDKTGEIYTPDFYDLTDFDCILTNLSLNKVEKGKFRLPPSEKERTESILKRSLAVEKGEVSSPSLTEEHPDGLDLSLYKDEDQLKKRNSRKRKASQKRSKSATTKQDATKKSPATAKARKVTSTVKAPTKTMPAKKVTAAKKVVAQTEAKKSISSSRSTSRSKTKGPAKTTSVVDQKKAKVLAKIGRKAASKSSSSGTSSANKNVKSGAKQAAPISKKAPVKVPVKAQPRNSKRSTRK